MNFSRVLLLAASACVLAVALAGELCEPLTSSVTDDPHFTGFYGQRFEFQGRDKEVFNMLSDKHVQVNGLFVGNAKWSEEKTFVDAIAIAHAGTDKILLKCVNTSITAEVNGNLLSASEPLVLESDGIVVGEAARKGSQLLSVSVQIPGYDFTVFRRKNRFSSCYLNMDISISGSVSAVAHGLLGQTLRPVTTLDKDVEGKAAGKYHDGVFTLEGEEDDYLVRSGNMFGSDFRFNQYGAESSSLERGGSPLGVMHIVHDDEEHPHVGAGRRRLLAAVTCSDDATCVSGSCVCNSGFSGDGETCTPDTSPFTWNPDADGTSVTEQCTATALTATATDSCGASAFVSGPTSSITAGSCAYQYTDVMTWTGLDCDTTVKTMTVTYNVVDTNGPVISGVEADTDTECNNLPEPPIVTANDACEGSVQVNFAQSGTTSGACSGTVVRSWDAMDSCGNPSVQSQTITWSDTTAPAILGISDEVVMCASDVAGLGAPTTQDDCNAVSLSYADTSAAATCSDRYTITRTWTANDGCSTTSETQLITVDDTDPPVLTAPMSFQGTLYLQCPSQIPAESTAGFSAVDNCAYSVPVTVQTFDQSNSTHGVYLRKFQAVDNCGNGASLDQDIFVSDTTSPTFDSAPATTALPSHDPACASPNLDGTSLSISTSDNCGGTVSLSATYTTIVNSPSTCVYEVTFTATDDSGNTATFVMLQNSAAAVSAPTADNDPWTDSDVYVTVSGSQKVVLHGSSSLPTTSQQSAYMHSTAIIDTAESTAGCAWDAHVTNCGALTNISSGSSLDKTDFCENYYDDFGQCTYDAGSNSCAPCVVGCICVPA